MANEVKSMEEAIEEIELSIDDSALFPVCFGNHFVYLKSDIAIETLTKRIEDTKKTIALRHDLLDECEKKTADLKTRLYAKLGKAINLDYTDMNKV